MNYDGNDPGSGLPWAIAARGNPAMSNGGHFAGPGEGMPSLPPALMHMIAQMIAARAAGGGHPVDFGPSPGHSGAEPNRMHFQTTGSRMPSGGGMGLVPLPNPRPTPSDVVGRAVASGRPHAPATDPRNVLLQRLAALLHPHGGAAPALRSMPWMGA